LLDVVRPSGTQAREAIIARTAQNTAKNGKVTLRSAEMRRIARQVTSLALVRIKQGGRLNVRQREDLRRALAEAGENLGWGVTAAHSDDPVAAVNKTVKRMVRSGARSLKREVADDLTEKKREEKQLEKVIADIRALAADSSVEYPVEVSYSHTARDAASGLVTKTETLVFEDADEALQAAKKIEKRMGRWSKLRTQMVEDLKQRQKRVGEVTGNLSEFVESSRPLLRDIIVTLP
jgi:paraquat-inducible protein B